MAQIPANTRSEVTRWDGQPVEATRGTAVILDAPERHSGWVQSLIGQRLDVVQVRHLEYTDYIDNRRDAGWGKLTSGAHAFLPHTSFTIEPGSFVAYEQTS